MKFLPNFLSSRRATESKSRKVRWLVLIGAAVSAIAWRTQTVISRAPQRLKAAFGKSELADNGGVATQERPADTSHEQPVPMTAATSDQSTTEPKAAAQTAAPAGAHSASTADGDASAMRAAVAARLGEADTHDDAAERASDLATAGSATADNAGAARPQDDSAARAGDAATVQTAADKHGEAVRQTDGAARASGAATRASNTTAPTPPDTEPAGVDASGAFRPTKAEPDDFGVVVTDDEPSGLAGKTNWVDGLADGSCPDDHPIKGNASSRIYHLPGGGSYNQTHAEVCFATEEDAATAGFRPRAHR